MNRSSKSAPPKLGPGMGSRLSQSPAQELIEFGYKVELQEARHAFLHELWNHKAHTIMLYEQGILNEEQMHAASLKRQAAQDRMYEQQRAALMANTAQMGAGAMLAMYNLTGQKHEEFFRAFQAFQIAQTMINTYSAAVGAYNAMASIPYVGPALGAIAAAAAIAFGMAQVAAIASMKPGGGVSTAAAPPPSSGYAYAQPTEPRYEQPEAPRSMAINVHVYGNVVDHDAFARELVPALTKAVADGVR